MSASGQPSPRHTSFWRRARQWWAHTPALTSTPACPPAVEERNARRFGHFRLERPLGQGGAGQLYAAWDERQDRAVALKLLAATVARDAGREADTHSPEASVSGRMDARRRFLEEAKVVSSLHHPHIVAVHEAGEIEGCLYLAMELVPGSDLTRYLRPARLLPEPVALRAAAQVAEALAYAHDAGVLHRDIKPANVLLHLAEQHVKVTDFGIARTSDMDRSRSGVLVGTPAYMSPEQAAGALLDGRSDLYSLGVLLYQLVTGRLPYAADSMGQLLAQIALAVPPPLSTWRPDLPEELSVVVEQLLRKSPAARPTSAGEVARTLHALADRLSPPPSNPGRGGGLQGEPAGEPRHNRPS